MEGGAWSAGNSPHMLPERWLGGSAVKETGTEADPRDQGDKTSPRRPIRAREWKAWDSEAGVPQHSPRRRREETALMELKS